MKILNVTDHCVEGSSQRFGVTLERGGVKYTVYVEDKYDLARQVHKIKTRCESPDYKLIQADLFGLVGTEI